MHVRRTRNLLPRTVSLVVAAATGLALAVAVAPQAAAWQEPAASGFAGSGVDLTDIVRIAPGADGSQQAPVLTAGAAGQSVPALQIKLPIKTEADASSPGKQYATWQPGDVLTVAVPNGVSLASTPTVTASPLVNVADPAVSATAPALRATLTVDGGAAVTLEAPKFSVTVAPDRSSLKILITSSQWGGVSAAAQSAEWLNLASAEFTQADGGPVGAGAQPGFLLTVDGLKVTVDSSAAGAVTATVSGEASNGFYGKPEYATYPAQAPAACTVGAAGGTRLASYVGGTTTLGFLPPLGLSVKQPAGQVISASAELQQLPPIEVRGGFNAGTGYLVAGDVVSAAAGSPSLGAVLFDFPAHNPPIGYMDASMTTSGAVQGVALAPSAGQYGVARTAQLTLSATTGGSGTVTITNLRIAGFVPSGSAGARAIPAGSTVRLTVSAPSGGGAVSGGLAVNDAASVGCVTKPGASSFSKVVEPADGGGADFVATADLRVAQSSNRVGGLNRYDTAARLAQRYAASPGVAQPKAVVIANGENRKGGFDALSANYLAGQVGAPILLTAANALPGETALALRAMLAGASGPVTLYVMGKSDSVSDSVVSAALAVAQSAVSGTVTATRVAGSNRYATSAAAAGVGSVASVSFAAGSPQYKTAILASGVVSADALAAGPLSFSMGVPVMLTGAGDALPQEVSALISQQRIEQVFVLGGVDRISAGQLAQLRSLGVKVVKRIAGPNRFATSADLYSFATAPSNTSATDGGGLGWGGGAQIYLANGMTGFPDALAVGPLAGAGKSVLVTTGPSNLDPAVSALVKSLGKPLIALGQPATVPDLVLTRR